MRFPTVAKYWLNSSAADELSVLLDLACLLSMAYFFSRLHVFFDGSVLSGLKKSIE